MVPMSVFATPKDWPAVAFGRIRALAVVVAGLGALLAPQAAHAALPAYVRSIEYVPITLTNASSVSVGLTKGQTIANCVPFASSTFSGLTDFNTFLADVWFTAGPNVTAQKSGTGTVNLGVFVVEFDPAYVRVQSGAINTFTGLTGSNTLGTAVNQAKAALVFYYRSDDPSSDWGYNTVAGWFSANNTLAWQRELNPSDAINGHYFVFEALNTEFSVQARQFQIAGNATTGNVAIGSVAMNKTFLTASHSTNRQKDEPRQCSPQVYLNSATQIRADRWDNQNYYINIRAFAITFAGGETVERGSFSWALNDTVKTFTLATPVDPNEAIAWNSVNLQGAFAADSDHENDHDSTFQRLQLINGGTQIQADRLVTGYAANYNGGASRWEVIAFGPGGPSLTLANHSSGQVPDKFASTTPLTDVLYQFRLTRSGTVTVDTLRVNFTTGGGVANGDVTNAELWEDVDNDGVVDSPGDNQIGPSVTPSGGVITFGTNFSPSATGTNYLVRATVANLAAAETTTFAVGAADIDVVEGGVTESGTISNAVHTFDVPPAVIYYSIGTAAGALHSGNASATTGTLTLATAPTVNIGVGDQVRVGATAPRYYITGVVSPTVFTIQNSAASGGTPGDTNISFATTAVTIRRAFGSIAAAVSGSGNGTHLNLTGGDLVTPNYQLNWVSYNDGPLNVNTTTIVQGYVTDATHYIRLTVAGASDVATGVTQRHSGRAGTGVVVELTAATDPALNVAQAYTRVEWLEIDGNDFLGSTGVYTTGGGERALLRNLLIHHMSSTTAGTVGNGIGIAFGSTGGFEEVRNSFIYDFDEDGIAVNSSNVTIANCTIFRTRKIANGGEGIQVGGPPSSAAATNVISMANALGSSLASDFFTNAGGVLTCNNCISGDNTADDFGGTGNQINRAFARQFVSITSYADLHLKPGSDARDTGQSLAAFFTDDIDAQARPIGAAWDVGADEAPLGTPKLVIAGGSYAGNAADDRAIDVGFQPDFVLIDSQGTTAGDNAVVRTSTMGVDASKEIDPGGATALLTARIKSFTPTGFTVGTDADVNEAGAGRTYHWVAMRAGSGAMKVGSYTGNGGPTQTISGLGFTPVYVIVIPAAAQATIQRVATMAATYSQDFSAFSMTDGITGFRPDGFVVGGNARANNLNDVYHYVAWAAVPGYISVGSYIGNNTDNRSITGTGFLPKWVTIAESLVAGGSGNNASAHKPASTGIGTDLSLLYNTNVSENNNIQALQPDGFQVGTHGRINAAADPNAYHWAAFGPHQGGVNYRSISSRPNYGSGSVTATNGSRVVDATAGVQWVTNNRGRGDRIVFTADGGQNAYTVEAVLSETQLLLTYPYQGTSGSLKPYSLERKFVGMWDWERCIENHVQGCGTATWGETPVVSNSLVADDRSEIGIAYRDVGFPSGNRVAADGSFIPACGSGCEVLWLFEDSAVVTDASHTVTLTADGTNRHNGVPGAGVVFDNQTGDQSAITLNTEYATIEWIEIKRTLAAGEDGITVSGISAGSGSTGASNITIRNMIIHDVADAGLEIADGDVVLDAYNNIVYNAPRGILLNAATLQAWARVRLLSNTVYNNSTQGFRSTATTRPDRLLLRNNISWSSGGTNFSLAGAAIDAQSSHNLSRDGTSAAASPGGSGIVVLPLANMAFVSTAGGAEDLRIQSGSAAIGAGTDLSALFRTDIENEIRTGAWDVGADDEDGFTAVKLSAFTARGLDRAVLVEWRTEMELDNLGFHLYRGLSAAGPWQRLNAILVPGLGSSPEGKAYSWVDGGLANDATYFYRLEDVDRSGLVTSHGPVHATPAADGASEQGDLEDSGQSPGTSWKAHGDPADVSLRIRRRDARGVRLELRTGGYYTQTQADGTLRYYVPGFFETTEPGLPAVPVKRAWVDAEVGRGVRVAWVRPTEEVSLANQRARRAGAPQARAERDGTYRAIFRRVGSRDVAGLYPSELARVLGTAFQGETKRAYLELAPLRLDSASGRALLARRVEVQLSFVERVAGEDGSEGARGRRQPKRRRVFPGPGEPDEAAEDEAQESPAPAEILVRLAARASGLHGVSYASVGGAPALLGGRALPARSLRLSRRGEVVAFHVEPRAEEFGPGSTLYFVAAGPESAYGPETVYELGLGAGGTQMPVQATAALPGAAAQLEARLMLEKNTTYLPGLLSAAEPWFWDGYAAGSSREYALSVASPSGVGQARLQVELQGGSDLKLDPDHHVRALLNGVLVGEVRWDGLVGGGLEASFDANLLVPGTNTLRLENVDTTGALDSVVYLNRIALDYPREATAEAGRLEIRAATSGEVRAAGLGAGARLVDVSESVPKWLVGVESDTELLFAAGAGKSYQLVSAASVPAPQVRGVAAAGLRDATLQADWLVIAPQELMPAAEPLVRHREGQGLASRAVSLEQIQDEFGHGERSPQMIRDFLAYAYHHWAQPSVRYVLLLGDATYDPKEYLTTASRRDLVPTQQVKSMFLWTASDPWFAAVNGEDAIPDLALGRLTAGTLAEAEAVVAKLIAFEASGQSLSGKAVLVADNPDVAGDFEANANDIAGLLVPREVQRIYLSQLGAAGAKAAVLGAFDAGAALVSYVGHGSQGLWASEGILRSTDVALLKPQAQQPLVLTMTCSNGYFLSPGLNALSERLVLAGDKGAIGAFSPSGLSLDDAAHLYHRALVQQLQGGRHERIGDLVLQAQKDYADTGAFPELLALYHLFADPALRVR